ncbi:MAG TPA: DNA translocase FtsK [Candidatus Wildermuthbacteria bacterium]|nr:DNA translocase FtsK [Candidatus Wildermuthbacteria bacterium]
MSRTQKKGRFSIPENAKRWIWGVVMLTIAVIFLFAFIDKGGSAGAVFFDISRALAGKIVYIFPLFALLTGLVLFSMERYGKLLPFLALFLFLLGSTGMAAVFARNAEVDILLYGGWIGYLVSWPLFSAFGFWVGIIITFAIMAVGAVLFWQVLPHPRERDAFSNTAADKVKKIFEPKFEVRDVEETTVSEPISVETDTKEGKKELESVPIPLALLSTYKTPSIELLGGDGSVPNAGDIKMYSSVIKKTLQNFDIPVEISEVNIGPAVTQYAFKPAEGIKLSRIIALQNDLALSLAAHPIRIEAPIPGRSLVGIEIPNKVRATVSLRSLLENPEFNSGSSVLPIALGKDVSGRPIFADLARMPHMLVAGATGSGKTIALNNIILSLIYRHGPDSLRLVLVDPKRVEFPVYNELPHLLTPVILDTERTVNILKWMIKEMERRFKLFSEVRARDIASYRAMYTEELKKHEGTKEEVEMEQIPYLVIVIDELADLMASRGKEIEALIVRLAQMARAVGIHLVLATQRPSVEVITGLIKANITARAAFQVASQVDSRTILDMAGAEKLLGRGDMLFISTEYSKPRRIQGTFVSDKDVKKVVNWIAKENGTAEGQLEDDDLSSSVAESLEMPSGIHSETGDDDPIYEEARRLVVETRKASASFLQRRLKLGYARAARLLDIMEDRGVVGPADGAKPREIYVAAPEPGSQKSDWGSPKLGE